MSRTLVAALAGALLAVAPWMSGGAGAQDNSSNLAQYCADPFAQCEAAIDAGCLNPTVGPDAQSCDAQWARFDQCVSNTEEICGAAEVSAIAAPSDGTPVVPATENRVALVIGNSNYRGSIGSLRNPRNDAALMARTLRAVGFDVIEGIDLGFQDMKRAIRDFGRQLDTADGRTVALFYFAGHGVQLGGQNYLIPVDADIAREADVEVEAIPANDALAQMRYAEADVNLVFLDACRNNPFEEASFRSLTRGLARMNAPHGTLISFATAPGDVAEDGDGENSPFTAALVDAIRTPGVEVEAGMKRVRATVFEDTRQRQRPWTASSMTGEFFFLELQ